MRLFSDIEGLSMTFAFGATPIAAAITGQRAPELRTAPLALNANWGQSVPDQSGVLT